MLPQDIKDKTLLIAPLDWGMGHLTRCSSLINKLLENQNRVIFAGTHFQCEWIIKEFPKLQIEEINGYKITLNSEKSTYWQMLVQTARMAKVLKEENVTASCLAKKYDVDVIISDNRYAFRTASTVNILLTHQLSPPVPRLRSLITSKIVKWVNQFDFCWIPDVDNNGFCKDLNAVDLLIPKIYIGWLSRFHMIPTQLKYDYCFVASGPSPQIEHFTKEVYSVLKESKHNFIIVVPFDMKLEYQLVNPSTSDLNGVISQSKVVISRAGYTTIMEMVSINKKAILIPTPGQYEQEFLATKTEGANMIFCKLAELKLKLYE